MGGQVFCMSRDTGEDRDLADLSDEELGDLSQDFMEAMPEAMGKAMGVDFFSEIDEEEREEFSRQIEDVLTGFRDALQKDSEEEQAVAMFEVYEELIEEFFMSEEDEEDFEGDTGVEWLVEQLRFSIEDSRKSMEELGYVEYFDIIYGFAVDVFESGQAGEVTEFYAELDDTSQQAALQRVMNPVIMEYYDYIRDHPEISDGEEVRQYIEMYYELAELFGDVLPRFIAVLQIVNRGEESYEDLKDMGLNDLLQKLESKKYSRFNKLAEGIDRRLRNSIAHRDFTVDPVNNEIVFRDRGDLVAEMCFSEFQEEFFRLLALFNAVWVFRMVLKYLQFQSVPRAVEELREESEN